MVLLAELHREGNIAWYRNPDRAAQESLGATYEDGDEMKIVRPDFVFFSRLVDGTIAADIVDPHSTHLAEALPKLKGLAKYAEMNGGCYRRIESVAEIDGRYRALDLTKDNVRAKVQAATSAKSLYSSSDGSDFS